VSGARHHGPSGDNTTARARGRAAALRAPLPRADHAVSGHADGVPEFIKAAAPTEEALHALLQTVIAPLMRLLTRRGTLVEDDGQSYVAESDTDGETAGTLRPLQEGAVTYRIAFGPRAGRKVLALRGAMPREDAAYQPLYADIAGFSLHAAVRDEAHDRRRLERLCRYITLAALVPRPQMHLTRYHGVLAPNAKLRSRVVSKCRLLGVQLQAPQTRSAAIRSPCRRGRNKLAGRGCSSACSTSTCGAARAAAPERSREIKIIAAILERAAIDRILTHRRLDPRPPPR
jgi:hypothetical protein